MLRGMLLVAAALTLGSIPNSSDAADAPPSLGDGPTTADAGRTRPSSPFWNDGGGDSNRTSSDFLGDLPAKDIRAVPPARAADVRARWTYNQLVTDLSIATREVVADLEGREDYRKALAEEKAAYDEMAEARRKALAPLLNNDAFVASEGLRHDLTEKIREAADRPKPDFLQIDAMARLKMAYVSDNRKLENDALERDSAYQSAAAAT